MTTRYSDYFLQTALRVAVLVGLVFAMPFAASAAPKSPAPMGRPQKLSSPDAVPEGLSALEWSDLRQQYDQHRHAALPADGGYQARNPGQQWQTRFDGRGFTTKPDGAAWQWGLELTSYGFVGHERAVAGQPRVNTASQRVTYDWDATLQEWFVNDRRGLEHGFTVNQRPPRDESRSRRREEAHSKESEILNPKTEIDQTLLTSAATGEELTPLTFTLAVRGELRPEVQADGRGVRFVDAEGTAALTYAGLTVFDANGRKLPAHFEPVELERGVYAASTPESERTVKRSESRAPQTDTALLRLSIDERGARYPLTIDPIAQQAYLKASNTDAGDHFGHSVAVSGDTVVVGANFEDSSATGVNGDQSDNSATVSGAVYVFVRNGTTWTQQAYLKASNAGQWNYFGHAVAVSGNTIVVGAYSEKSTAIGVNGNQSQTEFTFGAAYVFVRSGTNWTQEAYLKASNTGNADQFGYAVAVSGNTIVVGAYGEDSGARGVNGSQSSNSAEDSGAAYVFVRSGTNWTQQAYLKASNTGGPLPGESIGDGFGWSVAVSGDTVLVGAPYEDSNATGVNGNQSNNSAYSSGAAYVFVRTGTNWTQQAYLKASNTGGGVLAVSDGDSFGTTVSASGDTVVVGAPYEDSNATGVNGSQISNSAGDSGAAYVFVRTGTNWTQQAYLKASNTEGEDWFGFSVAVSGDTVVVGAFPEDSNATGVNGNQSDNSAGGSGAAYVFVRTGTNWSQQAYLKASNTDGGDQFGFSVAMSGDTVVAGAGGWGGEASNATGVNGNQSDNSAANSGAAYIFTGVGPVIPRLATAWFNSTVLMISWPTNTPGFILQSATTLANGGDWQNSSLTPIVTNGQNTVTMNPTSPAAFLRLRQP